MASNEYCLDCEKSLNFSDDAISCDYGGAQPYVAGDGPYCLRCFDAALKEYYEEN